VSDSRWTNVPSFENFRTFPLSTTKTFPTPSTAIHWGATNSPFPVPDFPHFRTKAPSLVNSWTRLLPASATKTFPVGSTATPYGPMNWPSASPRVPHALRNVPHATGSVVVVGRTVVVVLVVVVATGTPHVGGRGL
jgi:hypothetical protein